MQKKDIRNLIVNEIYRMQKSGELKEGERIKIDNDILEMLLFKKIKKDDRIVKYITWSSDTDNLKYIDLSEISFDDVDYDCKLAIENGIIEDTVALSETNARIDFSKAASTTLSGIYFRGVDLSKSHIECIKKINDVILSDTNINPDDFNGVEADYVWLDNNDFSNKNFTFERTGESSYITDGKNIFSNVNLEDTGARITLKNQPDSMAALASLAPDYDGVRAFDGCYINNLSFEDFEDKVYSDSEEAKKHSI